MQIPEIAVQCTLFIFITALGLTVFRTAEVFLQTSLMVIVGGLAANAYGFMLSGISESLSITSILACPFDIAFLVLGGYYINLYSYPLLKFFSLFYFENAGLSYIIWKDVESIGKIELNFAVFTKLNQ